MMMKFDAEALASELFAEVRAHAEATLFSEGSVDLVLTAEEKLSRSLADAPLPDERALALVIGEVFWASMLAEEGRACRPRVAFSRGEPAPTHRFATPKPLTSEVLRKLSPTHGPRDCLVWELIAGEPMLTGIEIRPRPFNARHRSVVVEAPGPGAIDLTWDFFRLVTLRAGKTMRRSTAGLGDLHEVARLFGQKLGAFELSIATLIVEAIREEGHGGSLWLVTDPTNTEGIDVGTRLESDGHSILERFPKAADETHYRPWLHSVAKLAAVDGAVLADTNLRLLGFGAFIRKLDDNFEVARRVAGGKAQLITSPGDQGWGGRHRSAMAFCARYAPAVAFVVSEDGGITAVIGEKGAPVWCEPVVSLGVDF